MEQWWHILNPLPCDFHVTYTKSNIYFTIKVRLPTLFIIVGQARCSMEEGIDWIRTRGRQDTKQPPFHLCYLACFPVFSYASLSLCVFLWVSSCCFFVRKSCLFVLCKDSCILIPVSVCLSVLKYICLFFCHESLLFVLLSLARVSNDVLSVCFLCTNN